MRIVFFGLLFMLFSPGLHAQGNSIVFDSLKADGTISLNYGKLTRDQANSSTLSIRFKNTGKKPFSYINHGDAWFDVDHLVDHDKQVVIQPNAYGTYQFNLHLADRKSVV